MLFLSWKGRGYWVGVVGVVASLIGSASVEQATGDPNYYAEHQWPIAFVTLASALVLRIIWDKPGPPPPGMVEHPPRTFLQGIPPTPDAFMYVPIRWWIRLLLLASVALVAAELLIGKS